MLLKKYSIIDIIINLLIFLCIIYYLISFNKIGLWNDELASISLSEPSNHFKIFFKVHPHDTAPPLYGFILYFFRTLIVDNEFALKFFNLSFLFIALFIAYFLFIKKNSKGIKFNFFLLFFLSSSGIFIYSTQIRPYSLLISLCIVYSFLITSILDTRENNNKKNYIFLLTLLSILISYTHYYGLFYVIINYFFLFIAPKDNQFKKRIIKSFILFFFVFSIWAIHLLINDDQINFTDLSYKSTYISKNYDLLFVRQNISILISHFFNNKLLFIFFSIFFLIKVLLNLTSLIKIRSFFMDNYSYIIHFLNSFSLILFSLVVSIVNPIFGAKYFIVIFPGLYLSLTYFLFLFIKNRFNIFILVIIFFIFSCSLNFDIYNNRKDTGWRSTSLIIKNEPLCVNSTILVNSLEKRMSFYYYYFKDRSDISFINLNSLSREKKIDYIFSSKCPIKFWIGFTSEDYFLDKFNQIKYRLSDKSLLNNGEVVKNEDAFYFLK